jgi:hypothetical protein
VAVDLLDYVWFALAAIQTILEEFYNFAFDIASFPPRQTEWQHSRLFLQDLYFPWDPS